ncbi:MAG: DUF169 domain-containing protein [Desulfuromonadales bacterium]|nr:DUF169 domain-containing protein [Desulfuromonadales bacterium]
MEKVITQTEELLKVLGHDEGAYGISYTDTKPAGAFSPKKGVPISRELEEKRELDFKGVFSNFSCFYKNIWLARIKHQTATISKDEYGCMGGAYFAGYLNPYLRINPMYVSTGIPGIQPRGERYMPSPERAEAFMKEVEPPVAPKKFLVFKPLDQYNAEDMPEFIIFFARGEVIYGLCSLAWYTTGDFDLVRMPFGAGCTNLVTWPLYYKNRGEEKVVLGGADLSCRKYAKTDEMSFVVTLSLYKKMLEAMPESALYSESWETVRKKLERSKVA